MRWTYTNARSTLISMLHLRKKKEKITLLISSFLRTDGKDTLVTRISRRANQNVPWYSLLVAQSCSYGNSQHEKTFLFALFLKWHEDITAYDNFFVLLGSQTFESLLIKDEVVSGDFTLGSLLASFCPRCVFFLFFLFFSLIVKMCFSHKVRFQFTVTVLSYSVLKTFFCWSCKWYLEPKPIKVGLKDKHYFHLVLAFFLVSESDSAQIWNITITTTTSICNIIFQLKDITTKCSNFSINLVLHF